MSEDIQQIRLRHAERQAKIDNAARAAATGNRLAALCHGRSQEHTDRGVLLARVDELTAVLVEEQSNRALAVRIACEQAAHIRRICPCGLCRGSGVEQPADSLCHRCGGKGWNNNAASFDELTAQLAEALSTLRNARLSDEETKTKLAEAQKSAAAWEIQAQDLRDKLLQATNLCANGCGHPEHGGFCR